MTLAHHHNLHRQHIPPLILLALAAAPLLSKSAVIDNQSWLAAAVSVIVHVWHVKVWFNSYRFFIRLKSAVKVDLRMYTRHERSCIFFDGCPDSAAYSDDRGILLHPLQRPHLPLPPASEARARFITRSLPNTDSPHTPPSELPHNYHNIGFPLPQSLLSRMVLYPYLAVPPILSIPNTKQFFPPRPLLVLVVQVNATFIAGANITLVLGLRGGVFLYHRHKPKPKLTLR